jgi:hypothetical protein
MNNMMPAPPAIMTKEKIVVAMKASLERNPYHLLMDQESDLATAPLRLVTPTILPNLLLSKMNSMMPLKSMISFPCFAHLAPQESNEPSA